jgi:NAD(P)-dependent dehydrogenase (short-subunit alcohol dehydrogenase family)
VLDIGVAHTVLNGAGVVAFVGQRVTAAVPKHVEMDGVLGEASALGDVLELYGRSKLANILFTRELARGLAETGVTANCLHPGFVATGLGQRDSMIFGTVVRLSMLFAAKPEQGARTIIHLATSPDVASTTGSYFVGCREAVPSRSARDDGAAWRLWDESAQLALR